MTTRDLISALLNQDLNAEVRFEWSAYPDCHCTCREGGRCYCSEETYTATTETVDPFGKGVVVIRGRKQ